MASSSGRRILQLFAAFTVTAPVSLYLWWKCVPAYAALLGNCAGFILKFLFSIPVEHVIAKPAGFVNTQTTLIFQLSGHAPELDVGLLVTNIAPYIALILATPQIKVKRRLLILVYGILILMAIHLVYLVVTFRFASTIMASPELPTALAQFFFTLPFLLWIVFAYWEHLAVLLQDSTTAPPVQNGSPAAPEVGEEDGNQIP